MIIKDHCKPGGWRNPDGWLPVCGWPEQTVIQWGGGPGQKRPEHSYFFEAYPPGTFITGHGNTLADAEQDAYRQYMQTEDCKGHEFTRNWHDREYTNGAGFCIHCGLFRSKAFEPIQFCCQCNNPYGYATDNQNRWWCEKCWKDVPEEFMTNWQKELRIEEKEERMSKMSDEEFNQALGEVFDHILSMGEGIDKPT